MLDEMFMQVLDMTKIAGIVILAVIAARFLMRRAPKTFSYALWLVVLFRLLCPVSIEIPVSIVPEFTPVAEGYDLADEPISIAGATEAAYRAVGDAVNGGFGIQYIRTTQRNDSGGTVYTSTDWWDVWILFGQYVWVLGMVAMAGYSLVSYGKLRRKLIVKICLRDNIYIADDIQTPFVKGIAKPKIYLPPGLGEQEQDYIIRHEQYHIQRKDPFIKMLAFLALCIHWFNPLVWVAFILANKDMEMSCDEAVIRKLGPGIKADYAASLLTLSTGRYGITGMPLAFGEGDTKSRIRNLENWKKPAAWIVTASVILCVVLVIILIGNPVPKDTEVMGAEYEIGTVLYEATVGELGSVDIPDYYCVTADYHLYRGDIDADTGEVWSELGVLTPYGLTNQELQAFMPVDSMRKKAKIAQITDAYILRTEQDAFYLVFQTKEEKTYLAYGWEDVGERGDDASDDTRLSCLYRLESRFTAVDRTGSFFDRSLLAGTGSDVDIFYTWTNANLPGYVIVGFMSGEGGFNEKTDMGFAVFYHNEEESGYRLLDLHVYEDAALAENGIYLCEHPAVANIDGELKMDSTFDVILINNDDVAKVTRVCELENGEKKEDSDIFVNAHNAALFSWEHDDACMRVSYYFYDEEGNEISYSGLIPSAGEENSVEMLPTQAAMTGAFDSYLYVPIDGQTYRYERTDMDLNSVTKEKLIFSFTEDADPQNVDWKVYELKEYPDRRAVLTVAGADYEYVYQYSPSKRSDPDALDKAVESGYVVHVDGDVTNGQEIWEAFVNDTFQGKTASVQLAEYYTLNEESCSEEYYEAYQEDYPVLFLFDLTFDGSTYTLKWKEGDKEYIRQFQYLMYYTGEAPTVHATYDTYSRYVLTNDNKVTWEELQKGMFSSQLGDYIEHHTVYTDLR